MEQDKYSRALAPGVDTVIAVANPNPDITLTTRETLIVNTTGSSTTHHLPDGTKGFLKEITNGGPASSAHVSNANVAITSTNSAFGGNNALILTPGMSVRVVWDADLGGWCVVNVCGNVNAAWAGGG